MGKKANRGAAADWHQETKAVAADVEEFERQRLNLYYAAEKTNDSTPWPDTFERLGYPEVAAKIRQARAVLSEAYHLLPSD